MFVLFDMILLLSEALGLFVGLVRFVCMCVCVLSFPISQCCSFCIISQSGFLERWCTESDQAAFVPSRVSHGRSQQSYHGEQSSQARSMVPQAWQTVQIADCQAAPGWHDLHCFQPSRQRPGGLWPHNSPNTFLVCSSSPVPRGVGDPGERSWMSGQSVCQVLGRSVLHWRSQTLIHFRLLCFDKGGVTELIVEFKIHGKLNV